MSHYFLPVFFKNDISKILKKSLKIYPIKSQLKKRNFYAPKPQKQPPIRKHNILSDITNQNNSYRKKVQKQLPKIRSILSDRTNQSDFSPLNKTYFANYPGRYHQAQRSKNKRNVLPKIQHPIDIANGNASFPVRYYQSRPATNEGNILFGITNRNNIESVAYMKSIILQKEQSAMLEAPYYNNLQCQVDRYGQSYRWHFYR